MSMTDPIADFLTRIRNGIQAAHETVEIPASKLKTEMARILKEQGYIEGFDDRGPARRATPATDHASGSSTPSDRRPAISGLRRVSRPGQRHYVDASTSRKVQGGMGTSIVSTSHGVMTGHEARQAGRRRRGRGGGLVAQP